MAPRKIKALKKAPAATRLQPRGEVSEPLASPNPLPDASIYREVAQAEDAAKAGPVTNKPAKRACALCGLRKLADEYPLAQDRASRILITCSDCLDNIPLADHREVLDTLQTHDRVDLKRKRPARAAGEAVTAPSRKKAKRAPPPTHAECRICTETKALNEFPQPSLKPKAPPLNPWGSPGPLPVPPKARDIPHDCAAHLCARKTNKSGPICKECITSSLSASMSYKQADQLGCPDENCGKPWDSVQYIIKYLSNEDFTAYGEKLFGTYMATNRKVIYCPNPSCSTGGILDEASTARRGLPQMECSECATRFCANCKVPWHKDQTCQEYQISMLEDDKSDEIKSLKELQKLGARRCPHCAYGVVKIDGCPNMFCKCVLVGQFDGC